MHCLIGAEPPHYLRTSLPGAVGGGGERRKEDEKGEGEGEKQKNTHR